MKLSGKNFQPWPEFSIDISGLTILIGPSNHGKSSLYRALKGVLRNEIDAAFVRNPKNDPLEINLEIGDHKITAVRSKKGAVKYIINGEDFAKLDGEVPPQIKALKFTDIKIGDFSFDPIFGDQNRPQFLIDSTAFKPSEVNAILGAFGGTEKLEHGKKAANLQKTQKDGEARTLAGQIRGAEARKIELEALITVGDNLSSAISGLEEAIYTSEQEAHWYKTLFCINERLTPLHAILTALILPDISGLETLEQQIACAEQGAEALASAKWLNKPLNSINGLSAPWTIIVKLWKEVTLIEEAITSINSNSTNLAPTEDFSLQLNAVLQLQHSIKHLDSIIKLQQELDNYTKQLVDVETKLALVQEEQNRIEQTLICSKCGETVKHVCA